MTMTFDRSPLPSIGLGSHPAVALARFIAKLAGTLVQRHRERRAERELRWLADIGVTREDIERVIRRARREPPIAM
jgi:uncharacterized protein YjiS (DUF1127 family)